MSLTVTKTQVYNLLFALCIAIPYLGNYELTFAVWCMTIVVTLQKRFSLPFFHYALCFFLILLIAFASTDFGNSDLFYIIRDVTYLLKPIVGLLVGYQICKYISKDLFKTIIYVGLFIAALHIIVMLHAAIIYGARTVNDLRFHSGYFSDYEVYALVILLFHNRFEVYFSKQRFYLMTGILGLSVFLYLARSNFIQLFILVMAIKGYFILNKRALIAITSVVLLTLISYSAVLYINPKRNGEGLEAFLYKVKMAPIEPFKRKINTEDYIDFNDNYRSVEFNLTLRQVTYEGTQTILFGKGLGSQVDLKRDVYLGDMNLRYISVLHNGFMTVYLKAGVCGILLLVYSIVLLFRQRKEYIPINRQVNFLLVGTAVFLIVSNWVLMGYYFTHDSKSILVGLFIAYKERTRRQSRLHEDAPAESET